MFLIDIDLISKITGTRLSNNVKFEIYFLGLQKWYFPKMIQGFLVCFECPCVSKNETSFVLGGLGTSQNPEIIEMKSLGFSRKQIEKYYTETDDNHSPERLLLLPE